MGGLVGVIRLDGGSVDRSTINRWKTANRSSRVRSERSWASAYTPPPWLASGTSDPQPFELASGLTLFVEGRLDERDGVGRALGLAPRERSDAALMAAAYEAWGPTAHERLYGDFAVALWDERERCLTLARDALGTRGLYYHFDGSAVWFATALHHLLAIPEVPRELDELGLAGLMVRATDTRDRTLYRHIHRVPSGGTVMFRNGTCRKQQYWTLDRIAPVRLPKDDDYVDMARNLLDAAVASRLPPDGLVVTSLSGGFDSGAVTATAARLLGERRLTAITRVAGAHNPYRAFDEKALAGLVARGHRNIDWVVADELH